MIPFDLKFHNNVLRLHIIHKGFGRTTLAYLFVTLPFIYLNYLFHQFFFLLDEIFFPSYRNISVESTTFIVGPPRCGTSYFLNLLNKSGDISSMKLWELYFAPSICLKLFWLQIGKFDRFFGSPLYRMQQKLTDRIMGDFKKVHDTGLFHFEEDAMLFFHTGNSPFYLFSFPFEELIPQFMNYDRVASPAYKSKYMKYYKRCIQKHLFVFGRDKTYLSKNPFFSTYVQTLREHFQDAKFIFMVRTPYEVVPSAMSLSSFSKRYTRYVDDEFVKKMALRILHRHYTYPLEVLDFSDPRHNVMIKYGDLTSDPKMMVEKVLEQFQMPCSDLLRRALSEKQKQAKHYVSKNLYSLEKYNISEADFQQYFDGILASFGFEE